MTTYGDLTIVQLKNLLRERGASLTGKKKDLVQRLQFYDANNNFGARGPISQRNEMITKYLYTPKSEIFKDINADTDLPPLKMINVLNYLNRFNADIDRGRKMYENQFLLNIRLAVENLVYYFVGNCKASMKKAVSYNINIQITSSGTIEACQCDCGVGEPPNAHCKHIIALLLAIEQMKREKKIFLNVTCTQKLQSFHKPTKKYFGTPLKVQNLPIGKKSRYESMNFHPVDPTTLNRKKYRERVQNLCINFVGHFYSTMPYKYTTMPANPYAVIADHNYALDQHQQMLEKLLHLNVNDHEIQRIEILTRNQANSRHWEEIRRDRITASNFHACCKAVSTEAKTNLTQRLLNPSVFRSKQTQHGKDCEPKAISVYESYGVEVQKCGLILMKNKPYLGASPDGFIGDDVILEVKCPFNQRNHPIDEETIPYLWKDVNGHLYLEPTHPYYYQIQGQLMVTGRKYANLLVYTFIDWKVIDVPRNDLFINEMEQKLTSFYISYFQPALLEKKLYKNYSKCFSK